MSRVGCIGECMVELALPASGSAAGFGFAGDSFNTAVYLKRTGGGAVSVAYVTAIGTDPLSDRMLSALQAEDLDTDLVERRADRLPGIYAIATDAAGERSFSYWRETSAARTLFDPPAEVTLERLEPFDLLYLSGISIAILTEGVRERLLAFLRGWTERGGAIAFDSNYRPKLWPDEAAARFWMDAYWKVSEVGLPSLDDEAALFGDADPEAVIDRLRRSGVRRGALKCGWRGPLPIGPCEDLPAFGRAASVVDTTAAGDSFNGAYLARMLAGASESACLLAGHEMACKVIAEPGAIIPR